MTMHDGMTGNNKPQRPTKADPRFTEDCAEGDWVEFVDGPPRIQCGLETALAPSCFGRVTAFIGGTPFVRFTLKNGSRTDLTLVLPKQRIRVRNT